MSSNRSNRKIICKQCGKDATIWQEGRSDGGRLGVDYDAWLDCPSGCVVPASELVDWR